ncbi:protein Red [Nephila pilipes]|uniref:Protein Red n=1 Tax=Nephila pilipes TaxID=299642 RepID=A0A8X6U9F8_NEPPI|nr:protein Red [Nephila pilipes]
MKKMPKPYWELIFENRYPEKSDFLPNRMTYIVDLEDEYADSDIPTTLLRSKADCPSFESQTTLTTNDIVIKNSTRNRSKDTLLLGVHKRDDRRLKAKLTSKLEGYAECYPGAPEQYSEYVSNNETLSKAVSRYGVKMADGRETGTEKRDGEKEKKKK